MTTIHNEQKKAAVRQACAGSDLGNLGVRQRSHHDLANSTASEPRQAMFGAEEIQRLATKEQANPGTEDITSPASLREWMTVFLLACTLVSDRNS